MQRVYKLKPDAEDHRDNIYKAKSHLTPAGLPGSVDLRANCSPIVDQGELGSCTANAIVSGMREYLMIQSGRPLVRLSRLFLYYEERLLEGTVNEDSGAEIRDGMKVLNTMGVCPESEEVYDITKFTVPPTPQEISDAQKYKISAYHRVPDFALLKTALVDKQPVVTGIMVYESFESKEVATTGIVPMPNVKTEKLLGGHSVLAVGYDEAREMIIVRNSWGVGWGDKGYCYLPYHYWTESLITDMWTGTL